MAKYVAAVMILVLTVALLGESIAEGSISAKWTVVLEFLGILAIAIGWFAFFRETLPRLRKTYRKFVLRRFNSRPPAHEDMFLDTKAPSLDAFRLDAVQKEFYKQAIVRGRTHLYAPTVAVDVIRKCKELGWEIRGLNAFSVTDTTTDPAQEHSAGADETMEGNWDEAVQFVQEKAETGVLFEVVYRRR